MARCTQARPGWARAIAGLGLAACIAIGCKAQPASGPISAEERQRIPGVIPFVSERGADKDVWLIRPTGVETRLTEGTEDDFPAAPSPDGKVVLVVATREDAGRHLEQLRLVTRDGGAIVPLHPPRARARNPSWAPDGAWFVAESDAQGFSDLVRMEPRAGAEVVRLQTAPEGNFEPSVSPDGKHVAFVSIRDGDPEIYVWTSVMAPRAG